MPVSFGVSKAILFSKGQSAAPLTLEIDTSLSSGLTYNLFASAPYNLTVDWGDGTTNTYSAGGTSADVSLNKIYASAGTYQIKVTGSAAALGLSSTSTNNNLRKLRRVLSWGNIANLTRLSIGNQSSLIEVPNNLPSTVTSLQRMFYTCTTFNQDISGWNTSAVSDMRGVFHGATTFNQNIGAWNTGNVTNMAEIFRGASVFNQPIGTWNISKVTTFTDSFNQASSFNQNIGAWDMSLVADMQNCFSFATAFNNGGSPDINNWNTSNLVAANGLFRSTAFNQNIGNWNVSKVTNFTGMFLNASAFNNGGSPDINNWQINTLSNVSFNQMFSGAVSFNQNIGAWNVAKVTSFDSMFLSATAFNNGGSANINNWTLNTTPAASVSMASMFQNAVAFNQPIGNWNTARVTNMQLMFAGGSGAKHSFNQNIGSWNVAAVTTMESMFDGNRSGSNSGHAFNNGGDPSINNWNTASVNNMQQMFRRSDFNQPIGNWNTGAVSNMARMFLSASNFNQDIGNWNVGSALDMGDMLNGTSFNFPLGNWRFTTNNNGPNAGGTGTLNCPMSAENWSKTLIGWANYISANPTDYAMRGISIGAQSLKYDAVNYGGTPYNTGAAARAYLLNNDTLLQNYTAACLSSTGSIIGLAAEYLYISTDSGATWTTGLTDEIRSWTGIVCSSDGTKFAAVASNQQIYTSTDSGATWTARESARNWTGIACSADGTRLVATVSSGQIYTSTDSGATWTARETSRAWQAITSSSDGTKLAAVVNGGQIYTSTDSGATWTARETNRGWYRIASSEDGLTLIASVSNGFLYTSTNGGANWTQRNFSSFYRGVAISANGSIMMACTSTNSANALLISTNGGSTWIGRTGLSGMPWHSVACSSDGSNIVAGVISGIRAGNSPYRSTDTGVTWSRLTKSNETGAGWSIFDSGLQPPQSTNLVLWLDAADGISQNAAGTTITTDSTAVQTIINRKTGGVNLAQSDLARRPLWRRAANGINNRSAWSFDGAGDVIITTSSIALSSFTIFSVFKINAGALLYEHQTDDYLNMGNFNTISAKRSVSGAAVTSGKNLTANWGNDNIAKIATHQFNGTHASHILRVNGILQTLTTGSSGGDPGGETITTSWHLGGRGSSGVAGVNGLVGEILVYNTSLSESNIMEIETYLKLKWGIL